MGAHIAAAVAFQGIRFIRALRVPSVAAFKRVTPDATVLIWLHPSVYQ